MSVPATTGSTIRSQLLATSTDFAKAAEHVSRACGQQLSAMATSIAEADFSGVGDRLKAIAESDAVVAIAGKLAALNLNLVKLRDDIAASGPVGEIIIGVVSVALGVNGVAAITTVVGATLAPTIAFLLAAGGLLLLLGGLKDLLGIGIGAAVTKFFDSFS